MIAKILRAATITATFTATLTTFTVASAACVVEDFAAIALRVHESETAAARRAEDENALKVVYELTNLKTPDVVTPAVGFTLAGDGGPVRSLGQPLGSDPQLLTLSLGVLDNETDALASALSLGRVDPLFVPSANDEERVERTAFAFLAVPDTIEELNSAVPDGGLAICDNRAGFVHTVSNQSEYSISTDDLELTLNNQELEIPDASAIGCDVADVVEEVAGVTKGVPQTQDGDLVIVHGACDLVTENPRHTVIVARQDGSVSVASFSGLVCLPFVRVVRVAEDERKRIAWVADATFAEIIDIDADPPVRIDDEPFEPPLALGGAAGNIVFVLSERGTLFARDGEGTVQSMTRASSTALAGARTIDDDILRKMIAADPSGGAALFAESVDGAGVAQPPFTLGVPDLNDQGQVVITQRGTEVAFAPGFLPTRILVMYGDDDDRENDVVVAMDAGGRVHIEGAGLDGPRTPLVPPPEQEHNVFALTFGRAIITAGGDPGHSVIVRGFDDAEIARLVPPRSTQ